MSVHQARPRPTTGAEQPALDDPHDVGGKRPGHQPSTSPCSCAEPTEAPVVPASHDRRRRRRPVVSVVVPTYNESDNVTLLLDRLGQVLADLDHEIIVVDDDSPDLTWQRALDHVGDDPRVTVIRRLGRRGLSSAVLDGLAVAQGRVLAVMDADLQHDERCLPEMVRTVLDDGIEVCLGSRAAPGGSYGSFGPGRRLISWTGATVARTLLGIRVTDPMTGYFAVSRDRFEAVRSQIDPRGFKIALELLARGPTPRIDEVGYRFRERHTGTTKLTTRVAVASLLSMALLGVTRSASPRFAAWVAVATTALGLRLSAQNILGWLTGPITAAVAAFVIATLFEFGGQRRVAVPPDRRTGRSRLRQLSTFTLIAIQSTLALEGVLVLFDRHRPPLDTWWGVVVSLGLSAGAVAASITVAFAANSTLTWPRHRTRLTDPTKTGREPGSTRNQARMA